MTSADRSNHAFVRGTWPYYRRVAIPSICLLLVAGWHFVRVTCHDQTPWKGGGFGMFSTIDSPGARYLRIYVVREGERIAVQEPIRLAKRARELRGAPNRAALEDFAGRLSQARWIQPSAPEGSPAEKDRPRVRAARLGEHVDPAADFPIDRVEVEYWRYRYDAAGRLVGRLHDAAAAAPQGAANG